MATVQELAQIQELGGDIQELRVYNAATRYYSLPFFPFVFQFPLFFSLSFRFAPTYLLLSYISAPFICYVDELLALTRTGVCYVFFYRIGV